MIPPASAAAVAMEALLALVRSARQRLARRSALRRLPEECMLADSGDRFELERRERAFTRRHVDEASLLGR